MNLFKFEEYVIEVKIQLGMGKSWRTQRRYAQFRYFIFILVVKDF